MRLTFTFIAIILLGVLSQSGCNSAEQTRNSGQAATASPVATAPPDNVRRITVAETKDLLAKNLAVIVDVRNEASYNAGHISGAKLIPVGDTANRFNELPKDKLIVTYCA